MSGFRELTKKEKVQIWCKADNEGIGYYVQNYARADFQGTYEEALIMQVRDGLNKIEALIGTFEEFVSDGDGDEGE